MGRWGGSAACQPDAAVLCLRWGHTTSRDQIVTCWVRQCRVLRVVRAEQSCVCMVVVSQRVLFGNNSGRLILCECGSLCFTIQGLAADFMQVKQSWKTSAACLFAFFQLPVLLSRSHQEGATGRGRRESPWRRKRRMAGKNLWKRKFVKVFRQFENKCTQFVLLTLG